MGRGVGGRVGTFKRLFEADKAIFEQEVSSKVVHSEQIFRVADISSR